METSGGSDDLIEMSIPYELSQAYDPEKLIYLANVMSSLTIKANRILGNIDISTIYVDYKSSMMRITGGSHKSVASAHKIINSILNLLDVEAYVKSKVYLDCLKDVDGSVVESALLKEEVFVGWNVRDGRLFICGNSASITKTALEMIDKLIHESRYPLKSSLSTPQKALLQKKRFDELVNNLKVNVPSLKLEFSKRRCVINFACFGKTAANYIRWSLNEFFDSNGTFVAFSQVQLNRLQSQLLRNDVDFVERRLKTELNSIGLIVENDVCKLKCASRKLLSQAKESLQKVLEAIKCKTISIAHVSLCNWVVSSNSINALNYIDTQCKTVSKLPALGIQKACVKQQVTSPESASALGWLFENWHLLHLYKSFVHKVKLVHSTCAQVC